MKSQALDRRVEILEQKVQEMETLPGRVAALELQISDFRGEVRAEFSATRTALREEMRTLNAETRNQIEETRAEMRTLNAETRNQIEATRAEMQTLNAETRNQIEATRAEMQTLSAETRNQIEETRAEMRVLHEDVIDRLKIVDLRPARKRANARKKR